VVITTGEPRDRQLEHVFGLDGVGSSATNRLQFVSKQRRTDPHEKLLKRRHIHPVAALELTLEQKSLFVNVPVQPVTENTVSTLVRSLSDRSTQQRDE
jgi:hypothetical protein